VASPVGETSTLGTIVRRAEETPEADSLRTLIAASCANGVLVLQTSLETIYGALPCDRFSEEQFGPLFEGREVAMVLEASADRFRILIETIEGAQAELTPDGIWIE
jgi:hypothetical protein